MNPRDSLPAAASLLPLRGGTDGPAAGGEQAALENYFARWRGAFEQAGARPPGGGGQSWELAGNLIRLRFAGDNLMAMLTPALAHLPAGQRDQGSGLEVLCWDGAATKCSHPSHPGAGPEHAVTTAQHRFRVLPNPSATGSNRALLSPEPRDPDRNDPTGHPGAARRTPVR